MDCINRMLDPKKIKKNIKMDRKSPITLLVPVFKIMTRKVIKDKKMRKDFNEIIDICKPSMTNEYFVLMDTLLGDVIHHVASMRKEDFSSFRNESLLVFSKEDTIFTEGLKKNLVDLMEEPVVVQDLKGGHLALMQSLDEYICIMDKFISERNGNYSIKE